MVDRLTHQAMTFVPYRELVNRIVSPCSVRFEFDEGGTCIARTSRREFAYRTIGLLVERQG
jgi:hypothetical protein